MFQSEIAYIKLSDLTRRVRQVIHEHFGEQTFWIVAEVSGHKFYPDRDRHYFDLVEKIEHSNSEAAKVKANSWEQGSRQIASFEHVTGQKFQDGLQVLACVKVNYHIVYGLSLTLVDLDPNFTLGNLERQRKETLAKLLEFNSDCIRLVDDRYITRNQELSLNCVIQRIALIGSPRSEGYTDFVHTIQTNQFGYKFLVDFYYSSVQGVSAENELVKTLLQVYERHQISPYDCVVITRGGGARTDFLVFDTYSLSRVVARFPVPIITGIGHHKDVSIVDLMAHTQTKTPTKAAEFILAHNRSFEENMLQYQQRLIIRVQQMLALENRRLQTTRHELVQSVPQQLSFQREQLTNVRNKLTHIPRQMLSHAVADMGTIQQSLLNCTRRILDRQDAILRQVFSRLALKPNEVVRHHKTDLDQTLRLLRLHCQRLFQDQHTSLRHQESLMRIMSPQNILKKGFAIVSKGDKIVINPAEIAPGDEITVSLDKTDLISVVNRKTESHGKYDV